MSVLHRILKRLENGGTFFETYGRSGDRIRSVESDEFARAIAAYRAAFRGWETRSYRDHKVVGLLFRPEESVEFLVATFAAIAEGFTVVPFYPNWSEETQILHLREYRIRSIVVGDGFLRRAQSWLGGEGAPLSKVIHVAPDLAAEGEPVADEYPCDLPDSHPCAWIFTSGTSGEIPKCTVISLRNIAAAVENIERVDFIREQMTIHSPLSTSHIFAFAVVLGIMAIRPRRLLFSDVQYLARLPEEKIGRVDGVILVPLVLNRMRSTFYEKLVEEKSPSSSLPLPLRRFLKRCLQSAEGSVLRMESGRLSGFLRYPAVAVSRALFGRRVLERLGSPRFVVVGGAKPSLAAMAFLEVCGIRCLQGWGMTETTGALAVCRLEDRFNGAYGTCGDVFQGTRAYVEDGELVVEGPQIAEGYIHPNGEFSPFNGVKRTGDCAEFDAKGRLRVLGKASDRITLLNGLNYNPVPFEEEIAAADLRERNLLDEVVVIGDGQPRLGCVFFVKESGLRRNGAVTVPGEVREYITDLLKARNAARPVDEQIGPWTIETTPIRETEFIGPSGKLRRRIVEARFAHLFEDREPVTKPREPVLQ